MFSDRRRLRRWAAQALLVWLFGLAMGVANACAPGEQARYRSDESADTVQQHQHGTERVDFAKANCLDFCKKSSIGALQLKVGGDSSGALGFALPVSDALAVVGKAAATVGRLMVDSPTLPGGPPPRIVFQRLAL